jgi:hypothetical protein
MRSSIFRSVVVCLAIAAPLGLAVAKEQEKPATDVKKARHPNLAAAQILISEAFAKLEAAQKANEYDLDGHAAKAKTLLSQAADEIKLAAAAANAKDGKDGKTRR